MAYYNTIDTTNFHYASSPAEESAYEYPGQTAGRVHQPRTFSDGWGTSAQREVMVDPPARFWPTINYSKDCAALSSIGVLCAKFQIRRYRTPRPGPGLETALSLQSASGPRNTAPAFRTGTIRKCRLVRIHSRLASWGIEVNPPHYTW